MRAQYTQPWELYSIDEDRVEERNLAAVQPERVAKMAAQWEAWAKRCEVLPWPLQAAAK